MSQRKRFRGKMRRGIGRQYRKARKARGRSGKGPGMRRRSSRGFSAFY